MAFTVTKELVKIVYDVVEGWYPTGRVDWEDVWERAERGTLEDGSEIDLGTDLLAPELLDLKKAVQKMRREAQ